MLVHVECIVLLNSTFRSSGEVPDIIIIIIIIIIITTTTFDFAMIKGEKCKKFPF